jgi:hypothetical protein
MPAYKLEDWNIGIWFPVRAVILSYPQRPDRLWGPHRPLSDVYQVLFNRG